MLGKKKEKDTANASSISILEMIKSLSPKELDELRAFLTNNSDSADELSTESDTQDAPLPDPSEESSELDAQQAEDADSDAAGDDSDNTDAQGELLDDAQTNEAEDAAISSAAAIPIQPEDMTAVAPLTSKEEALLAENSALREELEAMREEMSKTALDTPKFNPAGVNDNRAVIRRNSSYEEQATKYFK